MATSKQGNVKPNLSDNCVWCGKPFRDHRPKSDVIDMKVKCGMTQAGFATKDDVKHALKDK